MIFHSVPKQVQLLFPKRKWRGDGAGNQVYLTFDDGPVPGVTDYVISQLEARNQVATFFMVGDNVRKYSSLAKEVKSAGNQVGNHTYRHLNGYKADQKTYFEDFLKAEDALGNVFGAGSKLFRPPYGKMTHGQANSVRKTHQIIMWDVLSGDYHAGADSEKIVSETQKRTNAGSIIVFHDQQKTTKILPKILPRFLDFLLENDFKTGLL